MLNTKSIIKVLHEEAIIEVNTTFAKMMENPLSAEYAILQQTRREYPEFRVSRRQINKNTNQEHYKGLTYEYMEWYIIKYGPKDKDELAKVLAEFELQKDIAKCHSKSKRYPVVKRWFLDKFPEVAEFGIPKINKETEQNAELKVVNFEAANEEKKGA